ncbi:MAG: AmmeMemoRadiSam system radical SAM enzyme [Eggerthellaceae bacterium]|nr:AmmeMemoRadiSam system radical SAM enzyme [Eggerthellaceae bacterium]
MRTSATCTACPQTCMVEDGQLGYCRSRRSIDGKVKPEGYGRITSLALDPIEKKPLARYMPGTTVLSLGSYGCNMDCPFCQNASIAHAAADDIGWRAMQPQEVVYTALSLRDRRCVGIAYTYNEPLVNWEFLRDTGQLAHEAGLVNVLVSNGMATTRTLAKVVKLIDAANIDLKCFTEEGYLRLGGNLRAVKYTIERLAEQPNCHLEVTTLVVPGLSDDETQIDAIARWLAELDPSIPYHLTRFFPRHRMAHAEPTPVRTLYELAEVARRHLDDVMLGNV